MAWRRSSLANSLLMAKRERARARSLTAESIRIFREDGRDEMTVVVEATAQNTDLCAAMEAHLRTRLGVGITVALVGPHETAADTGIETRQKPIRLIDDR